jgi:hypothetical protein
MMHEPIRGTLKTWFRTSRTITTSAATNVAIPVTAMTMYAGDDSGQRTGSLITVLKTSVAFTIVFDRGTRDALPIRWSVILDNQPNAQYDEYNYVPTGEIFESTGGTPPGVETLSPLLENESGRFTCLSQELVHPINQSRDLVGTGTYPESYNYYWESADPFTIVYQQGTGRAVNKTIMVYFQNDNSQPATVYFWSVTQYVNGPLQIPLSARARAAHQQMEAARRSSHTTEQESTTEDTQIGRPPAPAQWQGTISAETSVTELDENRPPTDPAFNALSSYSHSIWDPASSHRWHDEL